MLDWAPAKSDARAGTLEGAQAGRFNPHTSLVQDDEGRMGQRRLEAGGNRRDGWQQ